MYATLAYNTTDANSANNLMADIVKVLTGTTDKTQLSSSLNQVGTSIISTVAGGWAMHDDVSAIKKVIKAPISDDPSKFKYVVFEVVSSAYILFEFYKSWNNVAHTGVRYRRYLDTVEQPVGAYNTANTAGYAFSAGQQSGNIFVSSSTNHIAIQGTYNTGVSTIGMSLFSERTRMSPWDTVANGYDPIIYTATSSHGLSYTSQKSINSPVGPLSSSSDYDFSSAHNNMGMMHLSTSVSATANAPSYTQQNIAIPDTILNGAKASVIPLISFGCHSMQYGHFGGEISSKCSIYLCPSTGQHNDLITVGGVNYRIWSGNGSAGSGFYFAVKEA